MLCISNSNICAKKGNPFESINVKNRSSKKSILYSDYNGDEESKNVNLGQRSISLTALPHPGPGSTSTAPATTTTTTTASSSGPTLEPRMAQLETLEAKMASIEVSLSTAQRRKNGKKIANGQLGLVSGKGSGLGSSSAMNILASIRSNTLIDTCRELEVLRNALKDKENTIQSLQGQVNCCGRLTSPQPFDSAERRVAELRLQTLKQEEESRKAAIKRINLALEQIDESESNIDVRIRQAELEYELGREELGLLGVREEMRSLQVRLDAKPMPTLYSCVSATGRSSLHCVQVEYDPKSPRFGAGNTDDRIGLFVLWAAEDSGLQKGDRILEVNGKMTLATSKEEMNRLLTVCPSRAEIVVNRAWMQPQSQTAEDFLRRENLRLTHRISYLEDQVAELLLHKEKSQSTAAAVPPAAPLKPAKFEKKLDVFQKGSQVTVLQNPELSKSESHLTTVTIGSPKSSSSDADAKICSVSVGPSEKYHESEGCHGFQARLHTAGEKIRALSKKYEKDEFSSTLAKSGRYRQSEDDRGKVKNCIPVEATYSLSDLERPTRKGNSYYNRVVDYSSETSCAQYRPHKDRSVKSLDLDGRDDRPRYKSDGHDSEPPLDGNKPIPPKKPIRLSIHRSGTSQGGGDTGYSLQSAIRKMKRSHKQEAPQPPTTAPDSRDESQSVSSDVINSRTSSRSESWLNHSDSGQSPFRWPGQHRSRSKNSEKWC